MSPRNMPPEMLALFRIAVKRCRAECQDGEDGDDEHFVALHAAISQAHRWRSLTSDRRLKRETVVKMLFAAIGDARRFDASLARSRRAAGWQE